MKINRPPALQPGDTIGIFTPSSPAYAYNEEKFQLGMSVLEKLGFKVKQGKLTEKRATQGYRPANGKERAQEFMQLYQDPDIKCLIATVGGANSNSMIEYLDYDFIQKHPKIVCGYSDVTSLSLALLHYGHLSTFNGPALMTWFSEYPEGEKETLESFLDAVTTRSSHPRQLRPFPKWSNHFRDWEDGSWKNVPREWQDNLGWKVLNPGKTQGEMLALNLNTLTCIAGTPCWPNFKDKVVLLEEMDAPFSRLERNLTQIKQTGAFDQISGLLFGKPEVLNPQGAAFSLDDLLLEIVGERNYPIISNVDISHTGPMHTIAQLTPVKLSARAGYDVSLEVLEPMVN